MTKPAVIPPPAGQPLGRLTFDPRLDPRYWVTSQRRLIRSPRLSLGVKQAYQNLCSYAPDGEQAWPGQERLAAEAPCSVRTMRHVLHELVYLGLITVQRGGPRTPNRYHLHALPAPDDDAGWAALESKMADPEPANPAGDTPHDHTLSPANPADDILSPANPAARSGLDRQILPPKYIYTNNRDPGESIPTTTNHTLPAESAGLESADPLEGDDPLLWVDGGGGMDEDGEPDDSAENALLADEISAATGIVADVALGLVLFARTRRGTSAPQYLRDLLAYIARTPSLRNPAGFLATTIRRNESRPALSAPPSPAETNGHGPGLIAEHYAPGGKYGHIFHRQSDQPLADPAPDPEQVRREVLALLRQVGGQGRPSRADLDGVIAAWEASDEPFYAWLGRVRSLASKLTDYVTLVTLIQQPNPVAVTVDNPG